MERKFPGCGNIKTNVPEGGMAGPCAFKRGKFKMELERGAWARSIQEGIGEAVNNIVKHFHKPEKEV